MATHAQASSAVATGDTTETSIGTLTMVAKSTRITGVWCQAIGGETLTSGESASGVFRLQSGDYDIGPLTLPLDVISTLTSGVAALRPTIIPVAIPIGGTGSIECLVTMDDAMTAGITARWGIITE